MKKISKDQENDLSAAAAELRARRIDIENSIEDYNKALRDAKETVENILGAMVDYQGERSEKWQEGEAGQSYQGWMDEFDNIELSEIEAPEMDHADAIDNLPRDPG